MAYQKLQVGLAAVVIKSDTIDIPLESSQQLSGTTTGTTADKLVDILDGYLDKKLNILQTEESTNE